MTMQRRARIATGLTIAILLLPAAPTVAQPAKEEQAMTILYPNGTRPSQKGPAEWFTGSVRIDPLNTAPAPARHGVARVTFEPGARTAWHTHPLGQTLIVTEGVGWTQCEGGPVVEMRAGDVIWCPPGHRHWHGATPTTAMTHIAIQEAQDGKMVEWMEHVTDDEYLAGTMEAPGGGS
ncbi:(R)-mandelonitrile lyase [Sphingobium yanoikuyae]|jgi:quercetin dioxygenase-like cupin family protein|uniref:(R)-mandelonitrile lyase n=1 Tax=Sphingobium yanoikuyae TaxID=13690 RepID=UPI0035C7E4C7